jgi:hypothetical protein
MLKKILFAIGMAVVISLLVPDHFANARTQSPDMCLAWVKKDVVNLDCTHNYTIHKKIGTNKYLVRDKKTNRILFICNNQKNVLVNCKRF